MTTVQIECPHCTSPIPAKATRCPQCAGDIAFCPRCDETVAAEVREKWVGLFRGSHQTQVKCRQCGRVLDGPRW